MILMVLNRWVVYSLQQGEHVPNVCILIFQSEKNFNVLFSDSDVLTGILEFGSYLLIGEMFGGAVFLDDGPERV